MTIVYGMIRLSVVLLIGIGLVAIGPSRKVIESTVRGTFNLISSAIPKAKAISDTLSSFILKIIDNFTENT